MNPITVSQSQFGEFEQCPECWRVQRVEGKERTSDEMNDGRALHRCLCGAHRAIMGSPDGIGQEDIEAVIQQYAPEFSSFAAYRKMAAGMKVYGERVNEERAQIQAAEEEVRLELPLPGVYLMGKVDRRDLTEMGFEIHDFKSMGKVPREADLENSLQFSLYNACYRYGEIRLPSGEWEKAGFRGAGWMVWHSILLNISVRAKADEANAKDAIDFAVSRTKLMIQYRRRKKKIMRVGANCLSCPVAGKCSAWKTFLKTLGIQAFSPTLNEYAFQRSRVSVSTRVKNELQSLIEERVRNTPGNVIEEGGWRAHLKTVPGGLPEGYAEKTKEELLELLTVPSSEKLEVNRIGTSIGTSGGEEDGET